MDAPPPVTFTTPGTPVLILLPGGFPYAVTAGETVRTVLARINAFRAPDRQITGLRSSGQRVPLDLRIFGRMVAHEESRGNWLQASPSSYRPTTPTT